VTESWRAVSQAIGVDLDRSRVQMLERYEGLLADRAVGLGLIARSDAGRIHERHVVDSLRAARIPEAGATVYDLGSGAGLPGVPVAIARPEVTVWVVERRARRAAFLELVQQELALANMTVIGSSAEDLEGQADVCLARAFAPLPRAWAVARELLGPGGRLVYFAGREPRPNDVPADAVLRAVVRTSVLESSGPLVIIARQ
jgi:16S rRNA (guanine527-N7)-methyltransferase